jgi:hypothetical protein
LAFARPEVGDLDAPVEADEHVAGRQIAVHEVQVLAVGARSPCAAASPGRSRREVHDHALGEGLARVEDGLHEARERDALHELDGEVRALVVASPSPRPRRRSGA